MDGHDPGEVTAEDVYNVAFSKPPFGERGYNEDEVDDFLEQVQRRLEDPAAVPRPTAADIAATSFSKPPIGKRGYAEDEVDGFLELVARQLATTDGGPPARPGRAVPPPAHYEAPPLDAPPVKKWWRIW